MLEKPIRSRKPGKPKLTHLDSTPTVLGPPTPFLRLSATRLPFWSPLRAFRLRRACHLQLLGHKRSVALEYRHHIHRRSRVRAHCETTMSLEGEKKGPGKACNRDLYLRFVAAAYIAGIAGSSKDP
jgi:hypothetical protein